MRLQAGRGGLFVLLLGGAAAAVPCHPTVAGAQQADPLTAPYEDCTSCSEWNQPQTPFRIFGNTYYVGSRGLTSLLITSPAGHVLIDGGLPDTAPLIIANVTALGFDIEDVELILNSHEHFDHSGGLAALERASGGRVAASEPAAPVLEGGASMPGDPQYGELFDFPPTGAVQRFQDGETLRVGDLVVTAHLTAGHTPGGTSWSWRSCEGTRCLDLVYADSQTPISADGFRYSDSPLVAAFQRGHAVIESLSCDILLTPHPGASSMWERLHGGPEGLIDPQACRRYAETAREALGRRLETEATQR